MVDLAIILGLVVTLTVVWFAVKGAFRRNPPYQGPPDDTDPGA